jgi:hypothetical protein
MNTTLDLDRLRHPLERPVWVFSVALNTVICVVAVATAIRGGVWLFAEFPFLARYEGEIRAVALAAVLAPPLLVFARNSRLARVRGGSVKVSPTQLPLIHHRFQELCARAGVEVPPTLWVTDEAVNVWARSFSAWKREYVVLGYDVLEKDRAELQDVWSFLLAREIGRLALGHVTAWNEFLVSYVERLPWVHRPLRHVRSYSLDRVGAHLVPDGVRALIIRASGRRPLPTLNAPEQIRYALSIGGIWVRIANLVQEEALIAIRMQNLYRDGFFDLEKDLSRFETDGEALEEATRGEAGSS